MHHLRRYVQPTYAAAAAALLLAIVLIGLPGQSCAQPVPERSIAVGAQMGAPTGLSIQVEEPRRTWDAHLAWRLDRYVVADGHLLIEEGPLPGILGRPDLRYQLGPGLYGRVRQGTGAGGPSGMLGLEWKYGSLELFARLTPRVELVPATRFGLGGGIGLRVAP